MAIKMVTDTIPTGPTKTFAQIVQEKVAARQGATVKTAAKEEDVEECECGEWEAANPNGTDMEEEKECMAEGDTEVKEAGSNEDDTAPSSGQLDVEPLHQKGESENAGNEDLCDDNVKKTEAESEEETKEAAGIDNFGDKKAEPFGKKEKEEDEEEKEASEDVNLIEASTGGKFVKLSKLNDKTRSFLRDYWRNLYPEEYVDAMLAD